MAVTFKGAMDPAERLDFLMQFFSGSSPVLDDGELIDTYSLAVTAEAAAYGLQIETVAPYNALLSPDKQNIKVWLTVDPTEQGNPDFADGVELGVEATIITDANPPRRRQRTFNVKVMQL